MQPRTLGAGEREEGAVYEGAAVHPHPSWSTSDEVGGPAKSLWPTSTAALEPCAGHIDLGFIPA